MHTHRHPHTTLMFTHTHNGLTHRCCQFCRVSAGLQKHHRDTKGGQSEGLLRGGRAPVLYFLGGDHVLVFETNKTSVFIQKYMKNTFIWFSVSHRIAQCIKWLNHDYFPKFPAPHDSEPVFNSSSHMQVLLHCYSVMQLCCYLNNRSAIWICVVIKEVSVALLNYINTILS